MGGLVSERKLFGGGGGYRALWRAGLHLSLFFLYLFYINFFLFFFF